MENKPDLTGKKILVAEDETANYRLIEIVLTGAGAQVIHASSGLEALQAMQSNEGVNLILMDLKMPVMNGHEATLKIREMCSDVPPIVAQTAYAMVEDVEKFANDFDDYITKPIRPSELLKKVAEILNII